MRVATTESDLFIFSTLDRTGWKAVVFVHLDIVFFGKTTISLYDADVSRFNIIFNVLRGQQPSENSQMYEQMLDWSIKYLKITCNE